MTTFDYPVWLRVDHWLNLLFVTLIIRSGIEILDSMRVSDVDNLRTFCNSSDRRTHRVA